MLSRPVRALWIEINVLYQPDTSWSSRPVRALGIEIVTLLFVGTVSNVEAREGLVD